MAANLFKPIANVTFVPPHCGMAEYEFVRHCASHPRRRHTSDHFGDLLRREKPPAIGGYLRLGWQRQQFATHGGDCSRTSADTPSVRGMASHEGRWRR
jgi:hypothetical protein